jgi:hypothetical protein
MEQVYKMNKMFASQTEKELEIMLRNTMPHKTSINDEQ